MNFWNPIKSQSISVECGNLWCMGKSCTPDSFSSLVLIDACSNQLWDWICSLLSGNVVLFMWFIVPLSPLLDVVSARWKFDPLFCAPYIHTYIHYPFHHIFFLSDRAFFLLVNKTCYTLLCVWTSSKKVMDVKKFYL